MATLVNGQLQYQSGEALPAQGTPEYNLSVSDPRSLLNFKTANPGLTFGSQDMQNYNSAQPIGSSLVTSNNPVVTPPNPYSTIPSGISGAADSSLASHDLNIANEAKTAAATADKINAKNDLQSTYDQILGIQSSRPNAEATAGIPEKNVLANDAYTSLQASKRAQEKELLAAEKSGGSAGGIARMQADINHRYAFEQADLSIALDVANRNLDAAQRTVDRKIQLQLEPLQTKLDFQKSFYQENKDLLTKSEDRQYQSMLTASTREYDIQKANAASIQDWIRTAITKGQPQLINAFSKLDPSSKTFAQDLAAVSGKLGTNVTSTYTIGADPIADSWVQAVLGGNSTMSQVPAGYRNQVALGLNQMPGGAYSPLAGSRYTLEATRIAKNFIDLPQFQLTANGLPYLQRIDAAMKVPGSVSDQDLLDSLTKLNTAGNAITDAQVRLVTDGRSFADSIGVWGNKLKNGGVLSDNQRTQIQAIAKNIYANYQKGYQPVYDQVSKQLTAAGIPKAFWTIPDLNNLSAQAQGQSVPKEGDTHDYNGTTYLVKNGAWVPK